MRVKISKSVAKGTVYAPPSKSMAHRLLIAAAMCEGESKIEGVPFCEDALATIDCLLSLGVRVDVLNDTVTVYGIDFTKAKPIAPLSSRESGSTLRFLIPAALLSGNEAVFIGSQRLIERPHEVYESLCSDRNLLFEKSDSEIRVRGPLGGGEIRIPGNVSSQFITGLMLALPNLKEDTRIVITTEIESRSYINMTAYAMHKFGIDVVWENERTIYIKGSQKYRPANVRVEGDYSGGAFIEAFNLFGGDVKVLGLYDESLQGDRIYREHFKALMEGKATISLKDCPDLGPILFAVAAAKHGGIFLDTKRLKIKESDRGTAMASELSKFGAKLDIRENEIIIDKQELHTPKETLSGHNDHRIVMSLSVLSSVFGGEIEGAEAVKKSYPAFFEDIKRLLVKAELYEA